MILFSSGRVKGEVERQDMGEEWRGWGEAGSSRETRALQRGVSTTEDR